ncbi:DUF4091 domain-containing protein [Sciscionella marina]|uniref:DUF4091 domain-containing protein n=1 Tax=Sciscionella marina TaxID=508770 RepID=UPI0003620489|nr:DUF4091 domain-containing protein [Sciscionella marina]
MQARSKQSPARRTLARLGVAVLAVILGTLGFTAPAGAAANSGPAVWTKDSADRVFSSSPEPAGATRSVSLDAARGEQEAAQIAVRAPAYRDLNFVHVTTGLLAGSRGIIPPSAVQLRKEYNHPHIQKIGGDIQQPPDGGNSYYDALVDNNPGRVAANSTQPYYFSVRVPEDQPPGVYRGQIIVLTEAGARVLPVSLRVYDVTLPPANEQHFQMNNWFTSAGWDYKGTVEAIPLQYGVQMYDPRWWQVIQNIARNMAEHRNNVIYTDFQALLIPATTIDDNGIYHFDWSVFDRFVQTFIDAGALEYIYTPTLLEPNSTGGSDLEMLKKVNGKTKRVLVPPGSQESNTYLDMLLPALRAHLDEKGWTKRFTMSAVDEPSQPSQATAANWFYQKYRNYFPDGNYSTNEAHNHQMPGIDPNLTTVTPVINLYEQNISYYQDLRISGTKLWLYTAIGPQGDEMNRFISYHLDKTRLIPWLIWKVGGIGYLHWGWNYWYQSQNPPWEKINTFDAPQTGDNYLVRPDVKRLGIYDSLRSETQLDGVEDYELLSKLAENSPLTARSISQRVIDSITAYTRDGNRVVDAHKALLEALDKGQGDASEPFQDSFTGGDTAWTHTVGNWSAANGQYTQSDPGAPDAVSAVRDRAWGDAEVRTTLSLGSGGYTSWAGVILRNSNAAEVDTGYLVGVHPDGELFIERTGKTVASTRISDYRPGTKLPLRITIRGTEIGVHLGEKLLLRYSDPQNGFTDGQIGLATNGTTATFGPVRIDPHPDTQTSPE